jgi:uncharacterized membrane protein YhaH (DUF805 family)
MLLILVVAALVLLPFLFDEGVTSQKSLIDLQHNLKSSGFDALERGVAAIRILGGAMLIFLFGISSFAVRRLRDIGWPVWLWPVYAVPVGFMYALLIVLPNVMEMFQGPAITFSEKNASGSEFEIMPALQTVMSFVNTYGLILPLLLCLWPGKK